MNNKKIFLEIKNVIKTFGPVKALNDASVKIYRGRVMGLIGENGAGKSTIIKCITGIHKLDGGQIFLNNKLMSFKGIRDSEKHGIAVVHQELQLVGNITVAENIFLGRLPHKFNLINRKIIESKANKYLKMLNLKIKPNQIVDNLTIANQQMVEIAKALSINAKLIILDEPTDALSEEETRILFETIRSLQKKGVSFLYVTHRMSEIHEICQDVTIFRDGKYITELESKNTPLKKMVSFMIGRELSEQFPPPVINVKKEAIKYEFLNFSNKYVSDISMYVKKGEILGLVGLIGSGRTEFVKSIIGAIPKNSGYIKRNGKLLNIKNIGDAIKKGIFYVSENRKHDGLNVNATIKDNIIVSSYNQVQLKWLKLINHLKIRKIVNEKKDELKIKMASQNNPVTSLSGGNQQKVLLAKALLTNPDLLILDEPTRGVDVGARKEIYSIIREITKKGTSIIMISSELPENIGMADRMMVFHEGKISGEVQKKNFNENYIMQLATKTGGK